MRAASRETYGEARDSLDALATTTPPETLDTIGEQLLAVADLLAREPGLRRALADPSRSGKDRAALLGGLVGNQVGTDTGKLLGMVASGRWSSTSELLDGVELLGVDALLASADRAGDLGEVEDELFRFGQIIDGNAQLAAVLGDTSTPASHRGTLVEELLAGKARPVTVRLAKLCLSGFGGRTFAAGLSRLVELAAARRDQQVAYVTVARPLTQPEVDRLGGELARIYGRAVDVKVTIDPSVLGGVRVLIGSDLYEGTTLRRLNDVRNALAGT